MELESESIFSGQSRSRLKFVDLAALVTTTLIGMYKIFVCQNRWGYRYIDHQNQRRFLPVVYAEVRRGENFLVYQSWEHQLMMYVVCRSAVACTVL